MADGIENELWHATGLVLFKKKNDWFPSTSLLSCYLYASNAPRPVWYVASFSDLMLQGGPIINAPLAKPCQTLFQDHSRSACFLFTLVLELHSSTKTDETNFRCLEVCSNMKLNFIEISRSIMFADYWSILCFYSLSHRKTMCWWNRHLGWFEELLLHFAMIWATGLCLLLSVYQTLHFPPEYTCLLPVRVVYSGCVSRNTC